MTAVRDGSKALLRDHARAAYDALARGYDTLTSGHDHHGWTALLERLARDATAPRTTTTPPLVALRPRARSVPAPASSAR